MLFEVPLDFTSGFGIGQYDYSYNLQNEGAYLNQGIDLQLDLDPVSYTHLDVYKRQSSPQGIPPASVASFLAISYSLLH